MFVYMSVYKPKEQFNLGHEFDLVITKGEMLVWKKGE